MKHALAIQVIFMLLVGGASAAAADDDGVMVRVRALRAVLQDSVVKGGVAAKSLVSSTSSGKRLGIVVDKEISDLTPQLSKLPFTHFSLLESETERIPLKSKSLLRLMSGDTLAVRPLGFENGKYCVWFKWMDKAGVRIIDTRLHLEPGRSMLTGTDGSNDTGTIIAIDVMPVE